MGSDESTRAAAQCDRAGIPRTRSVNYGMSAKLRWACSAFVQNKFREGWNLPRVFGDVIVATSKAGALINGNRNRSDPMVTTIRSPARRIIHVRQMPIDGTVIEEARHPCADS
jgi:hypothetical protein